jgi:hypothetical protein
MTTAKRGLIIICVTINFLVLGSYAIRVMATHHNVALYLIAAPSIGILCGLYYLHSHGRSGGSER